MLVICKARPEAPSRTARRPSRAGPEVTAWDGLRLRLEVCQARTAGLYGGLGVGIDPGTCLGFSDSVSSVLTVRIENNDIGTIGLTNSALHSASESNHTREQCLLSTEERKTCL